jgi:hypothetical protein
MSRKVGRQITPRNEPINASSSPKEAFYQMPAWNSTEIQEVRAYPISVSSLSFILSLLYYMMRRGFAFIFLNLSSSNFTDLHFVLLSCHFHSLPFPTLCPPLNVNKGTWISGPSHVHVIICQTRDEIVKVYFTSWVFFYKSQTMSSTLWKNTCTNCSIAPMYSLQWLFFMIFFQIMFYFYFKNCRMEKWMLIIVHFLFSRNPQHSHFCFTSFFIFIVLWWYCSF